MANYSNKIVDEVAASISRTKNVSVELKRKRIRFNYIKEVYKCVEEASKLKHVPMIYQETMVIPATSLLGIFTIDPSEAFWIEYGKDDKDFENFISHYEC